MSIETKFDPRTAFGNVALIKVIHEAEEKAEFEANSTPCTNCNSKGYVSHDCDCEFCTENSEDCKVCDGLGRVKK